MVVGCHVLRCDTGREGLLWRRSPVLGLVEVERDIAKAIGRMCWSSGPRCGRGKKLATSRMCMLLGARAARGEALVAGNQDRTGVPNSSPAWVFSFLKLNKLYLSMLIIKMLNHSKYVQIHTLTDPV